MKLMSQVTKDTENWQISLVGIEIGIGKQHNNYQGYSFISPKKCSSIQFHGAVELPVTHFTKKKKRVMGLMCTWETDARAGFPPTKSQSVCATLARPFFIIISH